MTQAKPKKALKSLFVKTEKDLLIYANLEILLTFME